MATCTRATSSTSAAGFKRDFTLLVTLIMISALSAVEYSDVYTGITYGRFINLENNLPAVMDTLWETWDSQSVDHCLLTGIAAWLLKPSSDLFDKPRPIEQQRRFQSLLGVYDSYTSSSIPLMTSKGLRFIEAALLFSLETPKVSDGNSKWESQTVELRNPWLVMHIHNILGRDWSIPRSMRKAVWGRLDRLDRRDLLSRLDHNEPLYDRFKQLNRLRQPKRLDRLRRFDRFDRPDPDRPNPLNPLIGLDRLDMLDILDAFDRLDTLNALDALDSLTGLDMLDMLDGFDSLNVLNGIRHDGCEELERLERLGREEPVQQSRTALEVIARRRLDLYQGEDKVLRLDLVALSLFLIPRKKDIFDDSRRLILEFFRSTPIAPSLSLPDANRPEVEPRKFCSDFFESKAIGDVLRYDAQGVTPKR